MGNKSILERNLLALSTRNPVLSIKTGQTELNPDIQSRSSKNGLPVPFYTRKGRSFFFHSLVDPKREGEGFCSLHTPSGYMVFLGLGGGYHRMPFLRYSSINKIIIVEKDISLFKSLLSMIDLYHLILDRRVEFLIDPSDREFRDFLLSSYVPALTGDLKTIPLRSRMQTEQEFFEGIVGCIKDTIGLLADDYTVQVHFGKKWFKNTLSNLKAAQETVTTLKPIRQALVTAAGPSLEEQLPILKKLRHEGTLIATDTSFNFLIENGIIPDIIISIDCQHITYHHFIQGYPAGVPLVLDLASPPALTRITNNRFFFTSGHPFSQYVNRNWRRFPHIDTSGGNVCHAAVSLADNLGASKTYLFGADFSYPRGKSYSRGTYMYPYFMSKASRTLPQEHSFYNFLMRNINIIKEKRDYGLIYTTRPMISYKERLEEASKDLSTRVVPVNGSGVPLVFPETSVKRDNSIQYVFSAGSPLHNWKEFITNYAERLATLPPPVEALTEYLSHLPPLQQDIWKTIYPVAAVIRKDAGETGQEGPDILNRSRKWVLDLIQAYMDLP